MRTQPYIFNSPPQDQEINLDYFSPVNGYQILRIDKTNGGGSVTSLEAPWTNTISSPQRALAHDRRQDTIQTRSGMILPIARTCVNRA